MGYFGVKKFYGKWFFVSSEGQPFFSLGLNHIDWNSLKNPYNLSIWKERFGSPQTFCRQVGKDLKNWGFNTIGWTQEFVVKEKDIGRHSDIWRHEDYLAADMPYCHMLPVAPVHQWDTETRRIDVRKPSFELWCDYVCRRDCIDMAEDEQLIGYFFTDCPNFYHASYNPDYMGPWFDPDVLKSEAGMKETFEAIEIYYKTITQAIRRYDKNHLILGDRYEAEAFLPDRHLQIASNYVDVLSFQYFAEAERIVKDFDRWSALTGLPCLLADSRPRFREFLPDEVEGECFLEYLETLFVSNVTIGWHYCGAYMKNNARRRGLRDEGFNERTALTHAVKAASDALKDKIKNYKE